jgi:hypothetical protein
MRIDPSVYAAFADALRDEFGEDDELVADMLEAETDLHDVMGRLLRAADEAGTYADGNKLLVKRYTDRRRAFEAREEAIRGVIERIMRAVGLTKLSHAYGTLTLARAGRAVHFTGDADALPDNLVRITRAPDMAAIRAALDAGEAVEGASLTNGGETLVIRKAR